MRKVPPLLVLALALCAAPCVPPAYAQFQITSSDGSAAVKIGALAQLQGEAIDTPFDDGTSQNLFVRRFRLLVGGRLGETITFFADTDSVNVGKADASGDKNNEVSLSLLDASVTWTPASPAFRLDVGQLLVPVSHNSGQGATTLLAVDYGPYTFSHSGPTDSKSGRDWGVQARGYLLGNHLEYRVGAFDGARAEGARNALRTVARVVFYPLDAETEFFYAGTYHGTKRVIGLGVSWDRQHDYEAYGADLFVDLPVAGTNVATFQADWTRYDGGETFASLPRQDALLLEAGFQFGAAHVGPFAQYAQRDVEDGRDEAYTQVGVAYWPSKHRLNVKAGLGRLERDGAPDRDQAVLQLQLFLF